MQNNSYKIYGRREEKWFATAAKVRVLIRQKLNEVVLVLTKMKKLVMRPTIKHTSSVVDLKKSSRPHLYILLPVLTECIATKEPMIKSALQDVFACLTQDIAIADAI
jgi:hypothetical protein